MKTTNKEKQLVAYLINTGARALRVSKKQEMKLREWIVAYLLTDMGLSSSPMPIEEVRTFIDQWENPELSEQNHKYYYVDKNTTGKSMRDLVGL